MRIGRTFIDTNDMTADELTTIIHELREIRSRKLKAEELKDRMTELLADAISEGFEFIDKDFGNCIRADELDLWDVKKE